MAWWLSGKESACNVGDVVSIPGSGRYPGKIKWQPTPVFLPGKSYGLRSLVGYSPWGCKDSDMTEQAHKCACAHGDAFHSVAMQHVSCCRNRFPEEHLC